LSGSAGPQRRFGLATASASSSTGTRLLHVTLIDTGQDPAPFSGLLRRARGSTLSANPRCASISASQVRAPQRRFAAQGARENAGYVRN